MIRNRVQAKLCRYFRRTKANIIKHCIRSLLCQTAEEKLLKRSLDRFFEDNSPEMVKYFHIIIFQCWAINDCKLKSEVTDKDFAQFLDQVDDLVNAAYRYHQKARLTNPITINNN